MLMADTEQNRTGNTDTKKEMDKTKDVFLEVGTALLGSAIVIGLEFVARVLLDPTKIGYYKSHPGDLKELLVIQFHVAAIAATLLLGAALRLEDKERGKLLFPVVVVGIGIGILLIMAAFAAIFDQWHPDYLKIWIPDLVSASLLFLSVRALRTH
jgi:hypothetical protein